MGTNILSKVEFMQLFHAAFHQSGLNGTLSEEQLIALMGVCHQVVIAEGEPAALFLKGAPDQQETLDFYSNERAKLPNEIVANTDTTARRITIGKLTQILFNSAMWEVSKTCRLGGHFSKLDLLAKYYELKWGNPIDGIHSIDAELNSRNDSNSNDGH